MGARPRNPHRPRFAAILAALVLGSGLAGLAAAGVEFAPPVSYPLPQPVTCVALGDLDLDGHLDAAVGTSYGHSVEIFLNRGDGSFTHASSVDAPPHAGLVIADLDGDGTPDLAVAGLDGTITVFHGIGGGGFAFAFSVSVGTQAAAIASADFNGDGLPDLAVVAGPAAGDTSSGYRAVVLINRGGSFADPARYQVDGSARAIAAGDLDGDHRPDLVTGNASGSASVLLNHGDGTFGADSTYYAPGIISSVAIGDLNGDGHPDLAVADEAGSMNVLLNDGHGSFTFAGNTPLYGRAEAVALADFDGDGHADVAVSRDDLGQVIALAGRGDGTFLFPALYFATGAGAHGIASGDVDGDGHPDLVTADADASGGGRGSMSVLLSGAPRTCKRVDLVSGVGASGLVASDFNADGALDLATTNEDGTLTVFLNDGLGGFRAGTHYPLGGTLSQNLAAADLDGDSRPDLVASNYVESTVTIYYNKGDGTFFGGRNLAVGPHPRWVEVADVDGDGRPDLVTADYTDAITNGLVSVLINQGKGNFAAPVNYPVGVGPYMVRAANMNKDEMPDLVVNNYDGQTVSVLINRGDGTFLPEVRYAAGWNLSSAIADLDHNGTNDVAVTNFKENTITIFKNDGNGALSRYADIPVGRNPRSIQAAILKGDGNIDLAVALSGTSQMLLLANDGNGGFPGTPAVCAVGVNPKTAIVADFDRNGGQDLATANNGAGTVSVLLDVSPPGSAPTRPASQRRAQRLAANEQPVPVFALGASRPNPARGTATISFETPREGVVDLRIFDLAGRTVRTLVKATLPAGPHEAPWDGTDDRGGRVGPGTYFYRLRAAEQQAVRVLILH
jgi:hypothetical protein